MTPVITLTKLDGTYFALNPDLIETVIENPDTTIHLTMKRFYIVKETMSEVIGKISEYRKEINDVFSRG
jgi:flagellar protein FlbD